MNDDLKRRARDVERLRESMRLADAAVARGNHPFGALVYGLSERRLAELTGTGGENPTLDLPCRQVFAAGHRSVEVRGPFAELEDEIAAQQRAFWSR